MAVITISRNLASGGSMRCAEQEKGGGTNAEKYQLQSHGNYYDNIKKPLSI